MNALWLHHAGEGEVELFCCCSLKILKLVCLCIHPIWSDHGWEPSHQLCIHDNLSSLSATVRAPTHCSALCQSLIVITPIHPVFWSHLGAAGCIMGHLIGEQKGQLYSITKDKPQGIRIIVWLGCPKRLSPHNWVIQLINKNKIWLLSTGSEFQNLYNRPNFPNCSLLY